MRSRLSTVHPNCSSPLASFVSLPSLSCFLQLLSDTYSLVLSYYYQTNTPTMDVMKDANSSSQRDKVLGVPTVAWKFVRLIAHTGMYVISRKEVVDVLNNAADMAGRPFAYHALQQVDEAGDKFAALLGHGFRIIAALVTNGVSLSQQAGHGMVGRLLTGGEVRIELFKCPEAR